MLSMEYGRCFLKWARVVGCAILKIELMGVVERYALVMWNGMLLRLLMILLIGSLMDIAVYKSVSLRKPLPPLLGGVHQIACPVLYVSPAAARSAAVILVSYSVSLWFKFTKGILCVIEGMSMVLMASIFWSTVMALYLRKFRNLLIFVSSMVVWIFQSRLRDM
jgi:hypothetical protein